MYKQQFDASLSPSEVETILATLQTVRQKLPFLVALSPLERRRLRVIGMKTYTFVEQAIDLAENHPEIVPQCLDVVAARRNFTLFTTLNPILQALQELQELVKCTQMLAGSEAYASARLTYWSVKEIGQDRGLNGIKEELARQFKPSHKPGKTPTAAD